MPTCPRRHLPRSSGISVLYQAVHQQATASNTPPRQPLPPIPHYLIGPGPSQGPSPLHEFVILAPSPGYSHKLPTQTIARSLWILLQPRCGRLRTLLRTFSGLNALHLHFRGLPLSKDRVEKNAASKETRKKASFNDASLTRAASRKKLNLTCLLHQSRAKPRSKSPGYLKRYILDKPLLLGPSPIELEKRRFVFC